MTPSVFIAGAGPVGLTLALELTRFGVPVRIIDKTAQRTDKSKALVVWSRSLELFDRAGGSQDFVGAGLKVTATTMVAAGKRIGRVGFDKVDSPHPYALMLPQSETERLLEARLMRLGITVERRTELIDFAVRPDGVSITLAKPEGRPETVEAAWLVGCDGAHSAVRHGLGLPFAGDTLPSDWILADVHLSGVPHAPNELDLYWHASGLLALFPIARDRYRVIGDVGAGTGAARPSDPTMAEVQALLDERGPGGIVASDPLWLSAFRINERKVADYRAGRAFLAGDAAHVHSPAGGQGMNTGLQDAFNLAWKLALVCHGICAEEPLLGSYSTERSAVGAEVLANAGRLTAVAVMRNPVLQMLRNQVARFLFGLSAVQHKAADMLTEVSIHYAANPIVVAVSPAHHGPKAGERAPLRAGETPVGAGNRPRFVLFGPGGAAAAALCARFPDLIEPSVRPPFAEDGLWLVRPDGYVGLATQAGGWDAAQNYLAALAAHAAPAGL